MTRVRIQALLLISMIGLSLFLYGPTLWAHAQLNQFSMDLVRVWTPDTLTPTDSACPGEVDARKLADMQRRLSRAEAYDSHTALHQGQMACLQGSVTRAKTLWLAGLQQGDGHDPVLVLYAAVAGFVDGIVLDNSVSKGIGDYAARQSLRREREKDLKMALGWQEMAFAYDPTVKTANRLALLYKKMAREKDAERVWVLLENNYSVDSSVHWQAQAKILEEKRDWSGAMMAYLKAAKLAQKPSEAYGYYLNAGLNGRRAKAYKQAAEAYLQAMELMPGKINAYLGLGDVYRAQKAYEQAAKWYAQAQALFPEDHRPPYYLGLTMQAQKRYEEAIGDYDRSLELKPENPGALYQKAIALDALERRAVAIEALSRAIAQHVNPPQSWQELLARWRRYPEYSQDPDRWWERGQAAEKVKDWVRAAGIYAEGASKAQPPDDYRLLERAALMYRQLKEWDAAKAIYEDLVERYPEKINGYLNLGEVYRAQKKYQEAAAWFTRARKLFPEDNRPPYYLGLTAQGEQRYEEAIGYYDQSLELKPNNPGVLYHKATALDALRRRGEAIEVLKEAIAYHANPPASWEKLLARWERYPEYEEDPDRWWERGQAAEREKDWEQALSIYIEGASKAQPPDDYRLLERAALMYRHLKEWDAAKAIYEDLVERYPEKINGYLNLGEVYRARKHYQEAAIWYVRAQRIAPDDFRPPYYLGLAAFGAEQYEQALDEFDRALKLKPGYVYAFYYKALALKALERTDEAIVLLTQAIANHPNHPQSWQDLLTKWKEEAQ